jgi:hypothetical protein
MLVPSPLKLRLRTAMLRGYEIALFVAIVAAVGLAAVSTSPPQWAAKGDGQPPAYCGKIQSSAAVISR